MNKFKMIMLTKITTIVRYLTVYEENKAWELEIPYEINEEELLLNVEEQFLK